MNLSLVLAGVLGPTEIILIVLVVVLLFGGKKIPELMHGLGKGIKEFKEASKPNSEGPNNTTPTEKKD
ncbi:MAG: twin-arginine translocase TatA/TatE family subunit [Bacteroidales bacterium]|nr:twin-arginine translocase TatA/TatE family subunit [Bacteroidales bacterium]